MESGKLRAPGDRPIDLALMYTCSTVAGEMHHLALGSNVLHFFTSESPTKTERSRAARFEMAWERIQLGRSCALTYLHDVPTIRRYRTADIDAKLAVSYPQFEPLLSLPYDVDRHWHRETFNARVGTCGLGTTWGEAESMYRAFQRDMIALLSEDSTFLEAVAGSYDERYRRDEALFVGGRDLLRSGPEAWMIPSEDELARIDRGLGPPYTDLQSLARERVVLTDSPLPVVGGEPWDRVKWRFSAAAAAVHFFKSVSQNTCLGIRNVVLHEDRQSVAHPECHVLGLIPFCIQNPQLHIERRVNVWRVLLVRWIFATESAIHEDTERLDMLSGQNASEKWDHYDRFCALYMHRLFCRWITEAYSALPSNGMPAHSFSLVFDGDPAPGQSSAVFEMVKEGAAWQVAQAEWYTEQSLSPAFLARRKGGYYMSEVYPRAINDIVRGTSFITCNFPIGDAYDPEWVRERYSHLRFDRARDPLSNAPGVSWFREWTVHCVHTPIRLSPPLPALLADIALEDLIPVEQRPAA
ncbi:MAG: hypothetical protein Q9208_002472 [Pyrenodesmia sp. 3 TL-2023]